MKIVNTDQETWFDWPEGTYIQGRQYSIVRRTGKQAFVEAFPPGTYIRADADTVAEAEVLAWNQHLRELTCTHEFEPRGYTNGSGFCKHCNRFESGLFAAEQLGLKCIICGEWANYDVRGDSVYCHDHFPGREYMKLFKEEMEDVTLTPEDIGAVLDRMMQASKDDAS